ncbi:hypothetical protein RF11_15956 [Thelohanellus kitauei]|uniref:Uncharacterized protein n=1 Tax=Thelohanellus kitauei TaxID=669202 RepID=A0A0C2MXZ0_THEKT|nr:hypothetical protein RF11_15956 [Thelohanellus kitauei]
MLQNPIGGKFKVLWYGPWEVIEKVSDELYKLDCGKIIHYNRLKPFTTRKEFLSHVNDSGISPTMHQEKNNYYEFRMNMPSEEKVQESNIRRSTREHKKAWWYDHVMTELNNSEDSQGGEVLADEWRDVGQ